MLVPKLRFKEFNDEWKINKLNKVAVINPPNSTLPDKFIYIDLESVEKGILLNKRMIQKDNAPSRAQRTVELNDILFQTVRPYQQNNYFVNEIRNIPYIASTGYALIRTNENAYFLYTLMYRQEFLNQVLDRCTGTSFPAINSKDLGTIEIKIPSKKEQEKIANFLSLLDKKIELQKQKIETLTVYKAGVSQKLFQSIKNDKNASKIQINTFLKERKIYSEKGLEFPHVTLSKEGICDKTDRYNRDFLVTSDNKEYKITFLNDLCYNPANLKFGVICINEYGSAIFSPIYITLEIDSTLMDISFCKYYFTRNSFINKVRKYEQGTVYERMAVSVEDFLKHIDIFPCLEKQKEIAKILSNFDNKIFLQKQKLNKLNAIKKSLLQQMFI